jgi:hypothetical protein
LEYITTGSEVTGLNDLTTTSNDSSAQPTAQINVGSNDKYTVKTEEVNDGNAENVYIYDKS